MVVCIKMLLLEGYDSKTVMRMGPTLKDDFGFKTEVQESVRNI